MVAQHSSGRIAGSKGLRYSIWPHVFAMRLVHVFGRNARSLRLYTTSNGSKTSLDPSLYRYFSNISKFGSKCSTSNCFHTRTECVGSGLLTRFSPRLQHTNPFSLDSTQLREANYFAKLLHPNASSSFGLHCMIVAGQHIVAKGVTYRMMIHVSYVISCPKPLIISWPVACCLERSSSGHSSSLGGSIGHHQ